MQDTPGAALCICCEDCAACAQMLPPALGASVATLPRSGATPRVHPHDVWGVSDACHLCPAPGFCPGRQDPQCGGIPQEQEGNSSRIKRHLLIDTTWPQIRTNAPPPALESWVLKLPRFL